MGNLNSSKCLHTHLSCDNSDKYTTSDSATYNNADSPCKKSAIDVHSCLMSPIQFLIQFYFKNRQTAVSITNRASMYVM